jgi:hypothetical protein
MVPMQKGSPNNSGVERITKWFRRLKNIPKKVISKNVTEICTFSTYTHVRQTCLAYNFFLCIF